MTETDVRTRLLRWPLTSRRDRWYNTVVVSWLSGRRNREVQVTVSPKGSSVQVHVDGVKWGPVSHDGVQ